MRTIKLFVLFGTLILCGVGIMWVLGMLEGPDALDFLTKTGGVLGLLFLGSLLLKTISKPKPPASSNQNNRR